MRDFNHTVNVLVHAYLNDTLQHGSCSACAVGNIVGNGQWANYFVTTRLNVGSDQILLRSNGDFNQKIYPHRIMSVDLIVGHTGYTWEELAKIEFAFEAVRPAHHMQNHELDGYMFKGLMAVVDVLADIHGIDLKAKEEAKLLFVKA